MLKFFYISLFFSIPFNLFSTTPAVNVIKNGTVLVYYVYYDSKDYELTVKINKLDKEQVYTWNMVGVTNTSGVLKLDESAVNEATSIVHFMPSGNMTLNDQCAIIISKKIFNSIKDKNEVEINTNSENNERLNFGSPIYHTQSFLYNDNLLKEFNCISINHDDAQITYINNPDFPLIVKLELDWMLKLKSVYNK